MTLLYPLTSPLEKHSIRFRSKASGVERRDWRTGVSTTAVSEARCIFNEAGGRRVSNTNVIE